MAVIDDKKNNKIKRNICLFISASVLILLAAMRGEDVGTDVKIYQLPLYRKALVAGNLSNYLLFNFPAREPLYLIVTYFASKLGSMFWVFFANELIIVTFTYKALWQYRDKLDPALALGAFLFVYYCEGYNLARQQMAMSLVLYAIVLLDHNRIKLSFLLISLAFCIHYSSIISICIVILYIASKGKLKRVYSILFLLVSIIIGLYYREIFTFAIQLLKFLPQKYLESKYMNLLEDASGLNVTVMLLTIIELIIAFLLVKKNREPIFTKYFLLYMMLFSLAGALISGKAFAAYRIFLYCGFFSIFVVGRSKFISTSKQNRLLIESTVWIILLVYWIWFFAVKKNAEIYPYVFASIM